MYQKAKIRFGVERKSERENERENEKEPCASSCYTMQLFTLIASLSELCCGSSLRKRFYHHLLARVMLSVIGVRIGKYLQRGVRVCVCALAERCAVYPSSGPVNFDTGITG